MTRIGIFNRTFSRAETLQSYFGKNVAALAASDLPKALQTTGLLVNTTSAGLNNDGHIELPWSELHHASVVADIVYTPLVTPLLQTARARGHAVVPGLGMLLHQAVEGFEKWFGVRPSVTKELHDLVARDIDPEYQP